VCVCVQGGQVRPPEYLVCILHIDVLWIAVIYLSAGIIMIHYGYVATYSQTQEFLVTMYLKMIYEWTLASFVLVIVAGNTA